MYTSTSYSRAKFGLEARDVHRPKGKSCGYYMRIVFFFSSLIQSLIIVSLVLFLVYGQPEKAAEEKRVKELEQSFNRLSENNIKLRKEKGELAGALGARSGEKAALEKEVLELQKAVNTSADTAKSLQLRVSLCEVEKKQAMTRSTPVQCPTTPVQQPIVITPSSELKTLQSLNAQREAMIKLVQANFTQMVQYIRIERDNAIKERDGHHLTTITLRRENTMLKEQLTTYTKKCKEDFARSLEGIQTVTRGFLSKIDTMFPHSLTFHLTCEKQQEQMDKIRNSCTSLSKEVEDKFQRYLDNVGDKVAYIQGQSSALEVQNAHLTSDLQQCIHNRSVTAAEGSRLLQESQQSHDQQVETLLKEQNHLRGEKKLQLERLTLMEAEAQALNLRIQTLQASCNPKSAASKPGGQQGGAGAQNRQANMKGPSAGAPGISKPPTAH